MNQDLTYKTSQPSATQGINMINSARRYQTEVSGNFSGGLTQTDGNFSKFN
jgi:hypothetical protein